MKKESTGRSIDEIRAKALELGLNDTDILELTEGSGHGPTLLVLYEGRWIIGNDKQADGKPNQTASYQNIPSSKSLKGKIIYL